MGGGGVPGWVVGRAPQGASFLPWLLANGHPQIEIWKNTAVLARGYLQTAARKSGSAGDTELLDCGYSQMAAPEQRGAGRKIAGCVGGPWL